MHNTNIARSRLLVILGLCLPLACLSAPAGAAPTDNPTQTENRRPGTDAWRMVTEASHHEIEGYASATSVNHGESIRFYVNTTDPHYAIDVYRMGWYGGRGGRLMTHVGGLPGVRQITPAPVAATGLLDCDWKSPYTLDTRKDWPSGVYVAKLTGMPSGRQSYILFVVHDDARRSDLLFQSSVTTMEAYNNWGGRSLYAFNSKDHRQADHVSFNRPYAGGSGAGDFWTWEFNVIRFLEREGYDVTYATNIDTHNRGESLLRHKAFLSVGHDEYWSRQMRKNVEAARDHGVSLGFFGSNTCYWQIRLEPSPKDRAPDRTIVAYKEAAWEKDPLAADSNKRRLDYLVTTKFRADPVNHPEDVLVGVMYHCDPVDGDIVVTNTRHGVFAGTGLHDGDHLAGLLGYETDHFFGNAPRGTVLLGHSPDNCGTADMSIYNWPSGATVFASGSNQWAWGLDAFNDFNAHPSRPNPAAQQITRNLLNRFIKAKRTRVYTGYDLPRGIIY